MRPQLDGCVAAKDGELEYEKLSLRGELRKLKKDRGVIGKDFEELLESTDTAAYQGPLEQFKHDQARLAKLKSTFS